MLCFCMCRFKLLSEVTCFSSEEHPLIFPISRVCQQQILLVFDYVGMPLFHLHFWKVDLLNVGFYIVFFFEHFECYPIATSIFSDEKSAVNLIGVPLNVMFHFSHVAFKTFSVFGFLHFYYVCGFLLANPTWGLLRFLDV